MLCNLNPQHYGLFMFFFIYKLGLGSGWNCIVLTYESMSSDHLNKGRSFTIPFHYWA